ncbi:MAG: calcium/sodium antiporter [Bacteroidales bacterium]|nr:calcium/sodium antiporter [Bacteroidales bacterium]
MAIEILLLVLGLGIIAAGAHFMVEGSSRIASRFGISDMVIGMTVVAIGTSAPEMVVSLMGALKGSVGIAVGNVVGSNICNILLIIGLSTLIFPMAVSREIINRDMQFMFLSTIALLTISFDVQINSLTIDDDMSSNFISRSEGIILVLFFLIFIVYSIASAKRGERTVEKASEEDKPKKQNMLLSLVMVAGGLAALIFGGDMLVDNATLIAKSAGVSDVVIGSTIVAIGTSLPELATSVVAAIRKKVGLALGNVVGSNIFNVFLILGGCATISPLPLANINHIHFVFLLLATILLLLTARTSFKIRRIEGAVLLAFYALYIIVNISVR